VPETEILIKISGPKRGRIWLGTEVDE